MIRLRLTLGTRVGSGILLGVAAAMASVAPASGQRATEPGQIERRIDRPAPTPRPPAVRPPPPAPAVLDKPIAPFTLTGVEITGATVFTAGELATLYEGFLGQTATQADIERLLAAITKKYRDAGYVLSRAVAPPQPIEFGILRVQVIEGYVERVVFTSDREMARGLVNSYARKITRSRPTRLAELERYILLINDLPGLTVRPTMRALDQPSGAYELNLALTHKAANAYASVDNRGTTATGPLQALAGVDLNSALGLHEQTRGVFFTVPDDPSELKFAQVSQEHRIGSEGTRVFVSGALSRLTTDSDSDGQPLAGRGTQLSFGAAHPFVRSRRLSVVAAGSFDASRSEQEKTGEDFDERLRVFRLAGRVAGEDGWDGSNGFGIEVSRGVEGLGASDPDTAQLSRADGDIEFTKVKADLSRLQRLGDHWSILASLAGQWSPDTLLSAEEFSLGARQYGRAFDPSEISGVSGAAGAIEIGYGREPGVFLLDSFQIYTFAEGGAVWTSDGFSEGMASIGVGIRWELFEGLSAEFEIAKPFLRPVANEGDRNPRFFFSVVGSL